MRQIAATTLRRCKIRNQIARESYVLRHGFLDPGQILEAAGNLLGGLAKEISVDIGQCLIQRVLSSRFSLKRASHVVDDLLEPGKLGNVPVGARLLDADGQLGEDERVGGNDGGRLGGEAEPCDDALHGWSCMLNWRSVSMEKSHLEARRPYEG
jgi:hypothetical protein